VTEPSRGGEQVMALVGAMGGILRLHPVPPAVCLRTLANVLAVTEPSHSARVPKFEGTLWPNSERAVGVVVWECPRWPDRDL
jgi:hypothetical protein